MTIREMLDMLEEVSGDYEVRTADNSYISYNFGSDRGYYYDMYISIPEIDSESEIIDTVFVFRDLLYEALSTATMTGYKGGAYEINNDTNVTLGGWGYMGDMIEELVFDGDICYVITKCDEW